MDAEKTEPLQRNNTGNQSAISSVGKERQIDRGNGGGEAAGIILDAGCQISPKSWGLIFSSQFFHWSFSTDLSFTASGMSRLLADSITDSLTNMVALALRAIAIASLGRA